MFRITKEILADTKNNIQYYFHYGINIIIWVLIFVFPFLMYYLGQNVFELRGKYSIGGEALIPIIFFIIIYYLKSFANKIGRGSEVPRPRKRFTKVLQDGEVELDAERLHEVILYLADLEDWLEKHEK